MNTQIKFSRQDYMSNKCTHREFYGQFVDNRIKSVVAAMVGVDKIITALANGDEHLNTIPLVKWDVIATPVTALYRLSGDYPTLSVGVCIAKEAAKQLAEAKKTIL